MGRKGFRMRCSMLGGLAALAFAFGPRGSAADYVNVAPMGTATQSTTLGGFVAALGIDGNYGNFTHTLASDTNPTWEVDLKKPYAISKIVLYNRTSCCQSRLRDITVSVLDASGTTAAFTSELLNPGNVLGGPMTLELDLEALTGAAVDGQIVRVHRTPDPAGESDEYRVLSLGEVEVLVDRAALPTSILTHPKGGKVYVGKCYVFSVALFNPENSSSITYRWLKDGEEIAGATGPRLILDNIQTSDAGTYVVEVTADGNVLVSEPAVLVVPGLNLALTGTATQSTTAYGGGPERAIDGNTSGVWGDASLTHTDNQAGAWWQVELYGDSTVEKIVLWNRTDCCGDRLSNFRVSALDGDGVEVFGQDFFTDLSFPGPSFEIAFPEPLKCRTVKIQRLGPDRNGANYLSLAEVEVFGSGPLPPPPALPNIARACGAVATQSSQLGGYGPGLAVDGNLATFTHTLNTDTNATWQVDLGRTYQIAIVLIHNRADCCGSRLRDITLSILDAAGNLVWESELLNPENVLGAFPNGPPTLTIDLRIENGAPVSGQIVRIHRTPDPDFSGGGDGTNTDEAVVLSLGEVEIFEPPSWCPAKGDTHCKGLAVEGPEGGLPGTYVAKADATDDSGDEILYTFTATNGVDPPVVVGPQASSRGNLRILSPGTWTISVTADDDPLCLDAASDAVCSATVEVVAPVGENLALGGTATQSSDYSPTLYLAPAAIDGNLTNFTHTAVGDLAPTWEVDLGAEAKIYAILLHNRADCCGSRLRDITVSIVDDLGGVVWESPLLNPENEMGEYPLGPPVLTVNVAAAEGGPVLGSAVRVTRTPDPDLSGTGGQGNEAEPMVLSLAEVQVFGFRCPAEGDTHCTGLVVEPAGDAEGETYPYLATVTATDDSGDAIAYTFTATKEGSEPIVIGPQAENSARFDLTAGRWTVTVRVDDDPDCADVAADASCSAEVEVAPPGIGPFLRGDANSDGRIDLSDGIFVLNFLFLSGPEPECMAAADTNGEGKLSITSGIYVLNFLFLGGPEPPPPYPDCGRSSAAGDVELGCEVPQPSCS